MNATQVEIDKHTRTYWRVFIALAILTVITVAVASVELAVGLGIGVALAIAVLKGSLVASFFMHLITEKRLIFIVLVFTVIFLAAVIILPLADFYNGVHN